MKKADIWIVVFIMLVSGVHALGISPSKTDVFYEPGSINELSLTIINNEHNNMKINLFSQGELADYIEFESQAISISQYESEKSIRYRLNLPSVLKPGDHSAQIVAVEAGTNSEESIMIAKVGIAHKINVRVPYPNRYLEGIFYINDETDNMQFTVTLTNVGTKDIEKIAAQILISSPDGEGVANLKTTVISLKKGDSSKIVADWAPNVAPGTYHVQAIIEYDTGNVLTISKEMDIGVPLVDIDDVSVGSFRLGTIAKLDITMSNKWNLDMPDVFAETEIRNPSGSLLSTYKTGTKKLPALSKSQFSSYWDTKDFEPKEYILAVKANYLGRIREESFTLDVRDKEIIVKSLTGQITKSTEGAKISFDILPFIVIIVFILLAILFIRRRTAPKKSEEIQVHARETHPELILFLKTKIKEGFSEEALRDSLMKKGWPQKLIDEAMLDAEDEINLGK